MCGVLGHSDNQRECCRQWEVDPPSETTVPLEDFAPSLWCHTVPHQASYQPKCLHVPMYPSVLPMCATGVHRGPGHVGLLAMLVYSLWEKDLKP